MAKTNWRSGTEFTTDWAGRNFGGGVPGTPSSQLDYQVTPGDGSAATTDGRIAGHVHAGAPGGNNDGNNGRIVLDAYPSGPYAGQSQHCVGKLPTANLADYSCNAGTPFVADIVGGGTANLVYAKFGQLVVLSLPTITGTGLTWSTPPFSPLGGSQKVPCMITAMAGTIGPVYTMGFATITADGISLEVAGLVTGDTTVVAAGTGTPSGMQQQTVSFISAT